MEGTITVKEFAEMIGRDQKSVRRVLRKVAQETPGKGGRWEIPVEMVEELKELFAGSNGNTTTLRLAETGDEA